MGRGLKVQKREYREVNIEGVGHRNRRDDDSNRMRKGKGTESLHWPLSFDIMTPAKSYHKSVLIVRVLVRLNSQQLNQQSLFFLLSIP